LKREAVEILKPQFPFKEQQISVGALNYFDKPVSPDKDAVHTLVTIPSSATLESPLSEDHLRVKIKPSIIVEEEKKDEEEDEEEDEDSDDIWLEIIVFIDKLTKGPCMCEDHENANDPACI